MRVVVFGTRELGYYVAKAIAGGRSHHWLAGVVSWDYDITEGYEIAQYRSLCDGLRVPHLASDRLTMHLDTIRSWNADIGVSAYWRRLFDVETVSLFKHGIINIHGSDLPKYRGFASTSWAILLGDTQAAVTIHKVVPGEADTGDILAKAYATITPETTILSLQEQMWSSATPLVVSVLDGIESGKQIARLPQDSEEELVMAYPRLPQDGLIDWNRSAEEIDRLVRAVTRPYPGAYTYYNHHGVWQKVMVWRAHPIAGPAYVGVPGHVVRHDTEHGYSVVLTGRGFLALDEVEMRGRSFAPGREWVSLQMRLGMATQDTVAELQAEIAQLRETVTALSATHKTPDSVVDRLPRD